jgi:hypothetical protein
MSEYHEDCHGVSSSLQVVISNLALIGCQLLLLIHEYRHEAFL